MLKIDSRYYDGNEFRLLFDRMRQNEAWRNPEGRRYALCLKTAFELLGSVLYLRDRGGSALLIHADTPLESAVELAENGDCSYLLYGNLETAIEVKVSASPYEPSVLQFSSGTTGAPKLIARSWERVDEEIGHYNRLFGDKPYEQPVILVPVSHSFGLITGTLASWAREVEPAIVQDKNPKFALHAIRTAKDPIVYTSPFQYSVLDSLSKGELRCHKTVVSGSPPSEALLTRMKAQTDEVWQQYGCTEVGCISVGKHPSAHTDVGQPLGHLAVSIRTEDSEADRQGEIMVSLGGSGAIGSKDLGYMDPDTGRLHVLGRLDDLINVSGLKVIPSEVEAVIGALPGVSETIVVRTAHKVWGEAARALVVADSSIKEQDVRSWCVRRLPAFKVPSVIELVTEIPKLPSGKVSRKLLQEKERS